MIFDWDPRKSERNYTLRGFDFAFAAQLFTGTYVEFDDTRHEYGERRVVAVGIADGIPLTVVFTDRATPDGTIIRRLISARLSSRKERRQYAESLEAIRPPDDPNDPNARPR